MRISDWSSDVCSSDLGAECRIHDSFRCCRCSCSEIGNQSRDRNDYSKQDNVVYGLAKPSMKETPCRFEQCKGDENGSKGYNERYCNFGKYRNCEDDHHRETRDHPYQERSRQGEERVSKSK